MFADSMSLPMEVRFTNPAAPLFIDIEGDMVKVLFVISTSHVPGVTTTAQHNSQNFNVRKRERAQSAAETPRFKRPMKAAQPMAPGIDHNKSNSSSRASSHMDGSMPPPSMIPNRGSYNFQSQNSTRTAGSSSTRERLPAIKKEPLFLPSSQMSEANVEILRSTGLGLENMDSAELAELLEGEGEEVDFSYMSQQPPRASPLSKGVGEGEGGSDHGMEVDEQDSFELAGLPATQEREDTYKVCFSISRLHITFVYLSQRQTFQPLFED